MHATSAPDNPYASGGRAGTHRLCPAWTLAALVAVAGAAGVSLATVARAEDSVVQFRPTDGEDGVAERFRLESHQFAFVIKPKPRSWLAAVSESELTFPSPVETSDVCNNTVHCEYFHPKGNGPHAGVIVLHILGGDFELSRTIGRSLAMSGVGALFVKLPYYGPRRPPGKRIRLVSEDLDQTVAGMTQAVLDIRRAVAWLGARDEIDESRLGITGISLGGIVGALAAANEPRLQRLCLILAGGDLETIILQSVETQRIRDAWADRTFDRNEVLAQLKLVDPLTYADQLKSRRVLMFNARHDRSIPPECTRKLWNAMGQPEIHWWDATHYSAIWFLPATCVRICQFFSEPK